MKEKEKRFLELMEKWADLGPLDKDYLKTIKEIKKLEKELRRGEVM